MALQNIDVKCFWVSSTGEECLQALPIDDLDAATQLMNEKNAIDEYETWSIVAELNL